MLKIKSRLQIIREYKANLIRGEVDVSIDYNYIEKKLIQLLASIGTVFAIMLLYVTDITGFLKISLGDSIILLGVSIFVAVVSERLPILTFFRFFTCLGKMLALGLILGYFIGLWGVCNSDII